MKTFFFALCLSISLNGLATDKPLEVTFVDVEGGQATLIVSPSGESLLVDTGWPGFGSRDADRIVAAARAASLKKIDYVLITHFHTDHVGGAAQLAARFPVGTFIDHGSTVEKGPNADELAAIYKTALARSRRLTLKAGDKVPLRGLDVTVLTASGATIATPVPDAGGPNPSCAEAKRADDDPGENAQSVGILVRHGKFRMIDLADLTWNKELELACPVNRAGRVDVYVTTHHGLNLSGAPALVRALAPRVAIMNNGARKGGHAESVETLLALPDLEDLWALHYAVESPVNLNAPPECVANLKEDCEGFGIQLTAASDGSFSVRNTRNGRTRQYEPRP
jgi:beta-lactamase superfamily II metal-dependent hydrolase